MDGFSFDESRYINSHIDYETFMRENIYIERTFVLPGDKLSVYKYVSTGDYSTSMMTEPIMLKLLLLMFTITNHFVI